MTGTGATAGLVLDVCLGGQEVHGPDPTGGDVLHVACGHLVHFLEHLVHGPAPTGGHVVHVLVRQVLQVAHGHSLASIGPAPIGAIDQTGLPEASLKLNGMLLEDANVTEEATR